MNQYQLSTAVGTILISWNDQTLLDRIEWVRTRKKRTVTQSRAPIPDALVELLNSIEEFFATGAPFKSIPWQMLSRGEWSEFQCAVYEATAMIPHGETRSYAWVAERIGKVFATRAVGQALRKNPFPILIPCHRVVASHGGVGGFMGKKDPEQPELKLKKQLIELEVNYRNPVFPFLADYWKTPQEERETVLA